MPLDTDCESAAVRKDLVSKDQMLDKRFVMISIDGYAKIVPAALIQIDKPIIEVHQKPWC